MFGPRVRTNIGKRFLVIVDIHFSDNKKKFKAALYRNNLKMSYSCTESMEAITNAYNNKVLRETPNEVLGCKCNDARLCPWREKCEIWGFIYQSTITSSGSAQNYIGLTENSIKQRYTQHKSDCSIQSKRYKTKLRSHVWN